MKDYDKYIFDIDYTILIPDWSFENDYFKKVIKPEQLESFLNKKQQIINEFENKSPKYDLQLLSRHFKSYGFDISVDLLKNWIDFDEREIIDTTIDGALELFKYLKNNNKNITILTNWFRKTQIHRLKKAGLYKYIDKIISGEDALKPTLKAFELAVGDTSKDKCIMIGDDLISDAKGAKKAGIDYYIVDKEHSLKDLLKKIKTVNTKY